MHYLACEMHSWCSGGHLNGLGVLYVLATVAGVIVAGLIIGAVLSALHWKPKPGPALLSRPYVPRGVTAVTPSGIRVAVACPHWRGHRTPEAAVACGERLKARLERYGR